MLTMASHSTNDVNKNDYVMEIQALWSPKTPEEANPTETFHPCSNSNNSNQDNDSSSDLEDQTNTATDTNVNDCELMECTIKSFDMFVFEESHAAHSRSYGKYEEVEALLFGMNKKRIDHEEALLLARKSPEDPVMVAVQALVQENCSVSKELWEKAKDLGLLSTAKQGNCLAEALAGKMMEKTIEGVHYLAEPYYEQGAAKNYATAQYFLGKSYEECLDFENASKWYEKSALQGHSSAQVKLGLLFRKGLTGGKDQAKAKSYFLAAANQGDVEGQFNLAFLLYEEQDAKSASYWYAKATKRDLSPKKGSTNENYWDEYKKAQSNLGQLFAQDQKGHYTSDPKTSLTSKTVTRTADEQISSKIQQERLNWLPNKHASEKTLQSEFKSNKPEHPATATTNSYMSLQSLSIGSKHTMSCNSTESLMPFSISRFESDNDQMTHANLYGDKPPLPPQKGSGSPARVSLESLGDLDDVQDKKDPEDMFLQKGEERYMSPSAEDFEGMEADEAVAEEDRTADKLKILRDEKMGPDYTEKADVIKPYHAVMGDKTARGPRLTTGTKELRDIKDWYRENKMLYQRSGRQSQLFDDAINRYYSKISKLFPNFPNDTPSREKTFLIHCSKNAIESGRIKEPNCLRHLNDKDYQYGTAKFPDAVLFYFNSRDPPKLDDQVAKYRRKLTSKKNLKGERRDYFEKYLEFCEMTVDLAANGSAAAQLATEKNNFIPTLKALWDDIEKDLQRQNENSLL